MKRWALAAILASVSAAALANPLADALQPGGTLCFTRTYDAHWLKVHRDQTVRDVKFALTYDRGAPSQPAMRVMLRRTGPPIYLFGSCGWMQGDLNRGVMNDVLDPTFKPTSGVGCHMMTDVTGVSAEEGGDFPAAWNSGRSIQAHLPETVAAWHSLDARHRASFVKLHKADRVVRLDRAPAAACRDLVTRFAPGEPH